MVVPGESEAVVELRDVDEPSPERNKVRVRMSGAGVNRGELIAGRRLRTDNPRARPSRAGIELAGTIEHLGPDVTGWAVGDRVMARATACYAELVVLDAAALMPIPSALSDAEAAAIPNAFVTAHDAIVTAANVVATDTALITAGSSGVGTAAIQIRGRVRWNWHRLAMDLNLSLNCGVERDLVTSTGKGRCKSHPGDRSDSGPPRQP